MNYFNNNNKTLSFLSIYKFCKSKSLTKLINFIVIVVVVVLINHYNNQSNNKQTFQIDRFKKIYKPVSLRIENSNFDI